MNDDIGRLATREYEVTLPDGSKGKLAFALCDLAQENALFSGGLPVAEFKQKPARARNRREIGVQAEPMKSTWDRRYLGK
ncbi:MAG: hypothetical protein Q8L22_21160 [Reyranella sp.]|nr:hypothetical protein [Reyranella sp.]